MVPDFRDGRSGRDMTILCAVVRLVQEGFAGVSV